MIDNAGTVLNHIVYDSFGQVTSETDPSLDFRFGYTGRERDEETGLLYYRARYYDPAVGTTEVVYFSSPERTEVCGICLKFIRSSFYLFPNEGDDTIIISQQLPNQLRNLHQITPSKFWRDIYGKPIRWCWYMENNQGYEDALQFEFSKDISDDSICIQIVVVASELFLKLVIDP